MREILFRVKDDFSNKWLYGYPVIAEDKEAMYFFTDEKNNNFRQNIAMRKTLGQYTGLTDKNGTKIFEGDIVIIKGDDEEPYTVDFDECCFQVYGNGVCFNMDNFYDHDLEVIGNIHDNPELLK